MRRQMVRLILFVATFGTTYFVGHITSNTQLYPYAGLWYSLPLMAILLGHEMGHYLMCRYYGVRATLPIFIPLPLPPFGTLGAVIMMRSPMPNRRAIFDIGLAGPLVGLALSLPAIIVGLHLSKTMDLKELLTYYAANKPWLCSVGEPLLFSGLRNAIVGQISADMALDFHPLAMAGWVGLFVTALNLLPVGQLDGGHVLYALFGRRSIAISHGVVGGALALSAFLMLKYGILWEYTVFVVLVSLLTYRFPHPAPTDEFDPIGPGRKLAGMLSLVLMAFSFTPQPFNIQDRGEVQEFLRQMDQEEQQPNWTPEELRMWTRKV